MYLFAASRHAFSLKQWEALRAASSSRRRGVQPCRYIYWWFRLLVGLPAVRDLLFRAKHLFVAATVNCPWGVDEEGAYS
jgi:hypothetical protein